VASLAVTVSRSMCAPRQRRARLSPARRPNASTAPIIRLPRRSTLPCQSAPHADFAWLPQETILFDTSRLRRRITVELAPTATLLMGELVILGRSAMGETLRTGLFHDQWRIKRDGQLLFAENVRLDGDVAAQLGRKGSAESARSFGTVVAVMPNAELKLAQLRGALTDEPHAAASRIGDMIVARVLAPTGLAARNAVSRVLETLNSDPLPRVWST
jgi:urease accessory protein